MDESAYSPAVLGHFRRPRRAGSLSAEGAEPDRIATGEAGDADEGRLVRIQLRVGQGPDRMIADARFKAFGCPATIACGSWVCDYVAGLPCAEAARLQGSGIERGLDLAPRHGAAAALVLSALRQALSRL